jgi:hypothetical protein
MPALDFIGYRMIVFQASRKNRDLRRRMAAQTVD